MAIDEQSYSFKATDPFKEYTDYSIYLTWLKI